MEIRMANHSCQISRLYPAWLRLFFSVLGLFQSILHTKLTLTLNPNLTLTLNPTLTLNHLVQWQKPNKRLSIYEGSILQVNQIIFLVRTKRRAAWRARPPWRESAWACNLRRCSSFTSKSFNNLWKLAARERGYELRLVCSAMNAHCSMTQLQLQRNLATEIRCRLKLSTH